jgi:hypothetical protein
MNVTHPRVRGIAAVVALASVVVLAAGCGSDSKSADTTAARTTSVPSTTTAAASTTRAPTTTVAPTASAAPSTTAAAATLSREAKLAVTKCLDDLSVPTTLLADLHVLDDSASTDAAATDCKEAGTQVDVDIKGSQLAVTLASIVVEITALKLAYATGASLEVGSDAANRYSTNIIPLVAKAQRQLEEAS